MKAVVKGLSRRENRSEGALSLVNQRYAILRAITRRVIQLKDAGTSFFRSAYPPANSIVNYI